MGVKDLGPGTSGYLDPDGRNWETTIYQAGKAVLDKELNLQGDIANDTERITRRIMSPSGWLDDGFLGETSSTDGFWALSTTANEIEFGAMPVIVNGWQFNVTASNDPATFQNLLDLGAGPAGAGTSRFDLVILEVWRRRIEASPSTTGKSPAGRIWFVGNVKIDAAQDLGLNFADDILDGAVGSETTQRVQIQYRLRVIPDVDMFGFPHGIDDAANVVANSVPAAPAAPDGVATAFSYANQSATGGVLDPGLWRAGDGVPANALGTVDGYMYGLPLVAVVRRNTTAFVKNTNHNGAVADPGPSDRPDGLFHDIIVDSDVIDLRMGVSPNGWNYEEVLRKNFNWLLDNENRTEIGSTLVGGGVDGHTVLTADEIGITNANGGDGTTTGDTPGANFIAQFDGARRDFSDRAVTEIVVLKYTPADGSGGGPNWGANDILTVDFTALPVEPGGLVNFAAYAPSDFQAEGVASFIYIGTTGAQQANGAIPELVTGLGGIPQGSLTVDIGALPAGTTDEDLYILLWINYPSGQGLTRTPTDEFTLDPAGVTGAVQVNNPGNLPADFSALEPGYVSSIFDFPHREITLRYETTSVVRALSVDASGPSDTIIVPDRVKSVNSITITPGGPYGGSITVDSTGFVVTLDPASLAPGDFVTIDYVAVRPLPQNDEQLTIYYNSRTSQTVREALIGTTLDVNPVHIDNYIYAMTVGSGSQDEAWPFQFQYVQSGGVFPSTSSTYAGDHVLDGAASIFVPDFHLQSGWMELPIMLGYRTEPNRATFSRDPGDIDAEGRTFFKASTGPYVPAIFAKTLSDARPHRNLMPFLAELPADTAYGKKGQLVLVLFARTTVIDDANGVFFIPDPAFNTTSASVFRLKGNLLNRRNS